MNGLKRLVAGLAVCAVLFTLCGQALAESYTVYVKRDGAKVYDKSGTELGTLSQDTKLKLTGVKGDICQVKRDGKAAYMKKEDLSKSPVGGEADSGSKAEKRVTVYVAKEGAKVYDKKGKVLGKAPLNAALTCTGLSGDICRVELDGRTG